MVVLRIYICAQENEVFLFMLPAAVCQLYQLVRWTPVGAFQVGEPSKQLALVKADHLHSQ